MSHNRVLLHPAYVERYRAALRQVRQAYADQFLGEVAALRAEVQELREILALVVTITRQQAETDVATLRRQLETALVRLAQRDPATPVH